MCLQYHEIVLRRRVVTQRRRLIDSPLLQRLQLNCHLQHKHENQIDLIASQLEWTRCLPCLTPMCNTLWISLHSFRVRSWHYLLISRTCLQTMVQIQSPTSSILFGHSDQKGREDFEGGACIAQGKHGLDLRYFGSYIGSLQTVQHYLCFGLNYFSVYKSWIVVFTTFI